MEIYNFSKFCENVSNDLDLPHFQVFGSGNSQDYDIMVFVDTIPKIIDEAHQICKKYNDLLLSLFVDKPLNCNIAVVKNGQITDVFKGIPCEVNNALYYTYDLHKQYYPNVIKSPSDREYDVKILRVVRGILSFYSRSHLRLQIKRALRGDLKEKLPILKMIDFESMTEFPGKKESTKDIFKVIGFQYGQLFSLVDGYEKDSYTKNGIIKNYPDLEPMLNRKDLSIKDMKILNKYKERLIELIEDRIDKMLSLIEK